MPGGCVSSSCGSGPAAEWSSICTGRSHEQPQQGSLENQPEPVSAPNPLPDHSEETGINTAFWTFWMRHRLILRLLLKLQPCCLIN